MGNRMDADSVQAARKPFFSCGRDGITWEVRALFARYRWRRGENRMACAVLAERELELADIRAQLRSFEGRYLRQVGVLYAKLDEWEAHIAELEASIDTGTEAQQRASAARQRADETHEATIGEASQARTSSPLRTSRACSAI